MLLELETTLPKGCSKFKLVRKLELYGGDANPTTNADGLLANFIPSAEEDLGAVNNRVDEGLKFPQVNQF